MIKKKCENCRKEFTAKRSDAKYCSSSCRSLSWQKENSEADAGTKLQMQLHGLVPDNSANVELPVPQKKKIIVKELNNDYLLLEKSIRKMEKEHQELEQVKKMLISDSSDLKRSRRKTFTRTKTTDYWKGGRI
jgi:hypothetical protein